MGASYDHRTRDRPCAWTGGDPVVLDGPFVEGKEVVSGYAEVEADDLDEVLRMVKTWPGCPVVEIRPLES